MSGTSGGIGGRTAGRVGGRLAGAPVILSALITDTCHPPRCIMPPRRRQAAPSSRAAGASLASLPDGLLERILGLLNQPDR